MLGVERAWRCARVAGHGPRAPDPLPWLAGDRHPEVSEAVTFGHTLQLWSVGYMAWWWPPNGEGTGVQ
jgi:hypothetical protein